MLYTEGFSPQKQTPIRTYPVLKFHGSLTSVGIPSLYCRTIIVHVIEKSGTNLRSEARGDNKHHLTSLKSSDKFHGKSFGEGSQWLGFGLDVFGSGKWMTGHNMKSVQSNLGTYV